MQYLKNLTCQVWRDNVHTKVDCFHFPEEEMYSTDYLIIRNKIMQKFIYAEFRTDRVIENEKS